MLVPFSLGERMLVSFSCMLVPFSCLLVSCSCLFASFLKQGPRRTCLISPIHDTHPLVNCCGRRWQHCTRSPFCAVWWWSQRPEMSSAWKAQRVCPRAWRTPLGGSTRSTLVTPAPFGSRMSTLIASLSLPRYDSRVCHPPPLRFALCLDEWAVAPGVTVQLTPLSRCPFVL